jgi:hypothetical protein
MMKKWILFSKFFGLSLVATLILSSCQFAAAPEATAIPTTASLASATPIVPAASPTLESSSTALPSLTNSPSPMPSLTPLPSSTPLPTQTAVSTPQINPGMNANCRIGPGTGYHIITFLQAGTNYMVIGQDGLGHWFLVRSAGNVDCWIGDPMAVTDGPMWLLPIVIAPSLPALPSKLVSTPHCNKVDHTHVVLIHWIDDPNVDCYNIYRNGLLLTTVGPDVAGYWDKPAPLKMRLLYEVEAFNYYGVGPRAQTIVPACGK